MTRFRRADDGKLWGTPLFRWHVRGFCDGLFNGASMAKHSVASVVKRFAESLYLIHG